MWERVLPVLLVLGCQGDPGELTAEAEPVPVVYTAGLVDADIPNCPEVWAAPVTSGTQPVDCTLITGASLRCDRIGDQATCLSAPPGWFYGDCAEMPGNAACVPHGVPQCGGVGLWVNGCAWTGGACVLRGINEAVQGCAVP